jgi:hypothetical protein
VDVVRLVASGMCFGASLVLLILFFLGTAFPTFPPLTLAQVSDG